MRHSSRIKYTLPTAVHVCETLSATSEVLMKAKLCFFDDYYIASRMGITRRYFHPDKMGEFSDNNASQQIYTSFFFDTSVNKYRLYYEKPTDKYGNTECRTLMLAEGDTVESFVDGTANISELSGLDDSLHGGSILFNESCEDIKRRYIFVGNTNHIQPSHTYLCMAFSSDGIIFTDQREIYHEMSDTYNSIYYVPSTKEYIITMRASCVDRRVFCICSKDLEHWSSPKLMLNPIPDLQGNGIQHYTMGVNYNDGIFYGILWRYITDLGQYDINDMCGYMENDLYYSYDGTLFSPTGLAPIVERPLPPEYGSKQLWLLNTCTDEKNDRTIVCGGASNICHGGTGAGKKFASTVFYSIRRDGFCALEGFGKNSVFVTKPFRCDGGKLIANYNALGGNLEVSVLNWDGKQLEEYSFEKCINLMGTDKIDGEITWNGKDFSELKGKRIRLCVRLNGALLYSLSFDGAPWLGGIQRSFNDYRSARIECGD